MPGRSTPRKPFEMARATHLQGAFKGALDGASALPAPVSADSSSQIGRNKSASVNFYQDRFKAIGGVQQISLTFVPVANSEHVYVLRGGGGGRSLLQNGAWKTSGDGRTIQVLSGANARAGDVIVVEYAHYNVATEPPKDDRRLVFRVPFPKFVWGISYWGYQGRSLTMDDLKRNGFMSFRTWTLDNPGPRPAFEYTVTSPGGYLNTSGSLAAGSYTFGSFSNPYWGFNPFERLWYVALTTPSEVGSWWWSEIGVWRYTWKFTWPDKAVCQGSGDFELMTRMVPYDFCVDEDNSQLTVNNTHPSRYSVSWIMRAPYTVVPYPSWAIGATGYRSTSPQALIRPGMQICSAYVVQKASRDANYEYITHNATVLPGVLHQGSYSGEFVYNPDVGAISNSVAGFGFVMDDADHDTPIDLWPPKPFFDALDESVSWAWPQHPNSEWSGWRYQSPEYMIQTNLLGSATPRAYADNKKYIDTRNHPFWVSSPYSNTQPWEGSVAAYKGS